MIASTLIAATVAAAQPQVAPAQPTNPHAGHGAMQHGDKTMACCKDMAKDEGCCCCKDGKHTKADAPAAPAHAGHGDHDH